MLRFIVQIDETNFNTGQRSKRFYTIDGELAQLESAMRTRNKDERDVVVLGVEILDPPN